MLECIIRLFNIWSFPTEICDWLKQHPLLADRILVFYSTLASIITFPQSTCAKQLLQLGMSLTLFLCVISITLFQSTITFYKLLYRVGRVFTMIPIDFGDFRSYKENSYKIIFIIIKIWHNQNIFLILKPFF